MLQELSEAVGISGQEDAVRAVILKAIAPHVTDVHIDALGSVTARLPAQPAVERPVRIMVAAHMDEIGLMVTGYDSDGLIRFTAVGGIDERILPGKRVWIGATPGVVIWTPVHLNSDQNAVKIKSLRIDIGATSKDEAAGRVKRGDAIHFDSRFIELDGGRVLRGKAFDDRAGCSLLIDLLHGGPYPVEVLAAFTVQEEIGLRGAQVAAQRLQPNVALVLEGTTANDLPEPLALADDTTEINPTCRQGDGPVLTLLDSSLIVDPRMLGWLRDAANASGIPVQYKSTPGGGTDGGAIHKANAGVPTAVISLPCRYIHSPAATLLRADYDAALALAQAALRRLTWDTISR